LSSSSSPLSCSHRVLLPLFRGFSPVHNRTYTKILFYWKLYKITFQTGTHSS
jgi:hypothetical protein